MNLKAVLMSRLDQFCDRWCFAIGSGDDQRQQHSESIAEARRIFDVISRGRFSQQIDERQRTLQLVTNTDHFVFIEALQKDRIIGGIVTVFSKYFQDLRRSIKARSAMLLRLFDFDINSSRSAS